MEELQQQIKEKLAVIYEPYRRPRTWDDEQRENSKYLLAEIFTNAALRNSERKNEIAMTFYWAMLIQANTELVAIETTNLQQQTADKKEILQLRGEIEHLQAEEIKGELRRKIEACRPQVQRCYLCSHLFNMEEGSMKIQVTKRQRKCTQELVSRGIGNPECVKQQDVARHQKRKPSSSALVPANGRNGKVI